VRCGLPEDVAHRDEAPIAPDALHDLIEAAADLLNEPFLALRLPGELSFSRYGLHELAARASATVRESLLHVARYASLIHPRLEFKLEEDSARSEARWHSRLIGFPRGVGRHAHEYALASVMTHLRRDVDRPLVAQRIWFVHPRPRELAPLYR